MVLLNPVFLEEMEELCTESLPWEEIDDSTFLIAGGTGLVGAGLTDFLIYRNEYKKADIKIYVMARNVESAKEQFGEFYEKKYFHFLKHDISQAINLDEFKDIKFDYIVHAASKADPISFASDPIGISNANYIGTNELLKLANTNCVKSFIYISSGEVYGIIDAINSEKGIDEEMQGTLEIKSARNSYGISKRAAENLCNCYCRQFNIVVKIARLCHTFGTTQTQNENRVIFQFLNNAINNQDILLKSVGVQKRSYLYLPDAIRGLLYIILKGKDGEAYNISDSKNVNTIKDLADLIADEFKVSVKMEIDEKKMNYIDSNISNAVLNSSKLEELGVNMKYDIHKGIHNYKLIMK